MGIDVYNQLNEDLVKVKKKQISDGDNQLSIELEDNEQKLDSLKKQYENLEFDKITVHEEKNQLSSQIDQLTITLQKNLGIFH